MSVDLNPDTETKKNILGQTKTTDNGYEPSMDADTYYANPDKKLYPKIRDIAMKRLKGADCKTLMLEVLVEDTSAENHLAYVEEVMVKPQSYGGDTSGVNIPFKVSSDGKRTEGYVSATSLASIFCHVLSFLPLNICGQRVSPYNTRLIICEPEYSS